MKPATVLKKLSHYLVITVLTSLVANGTLLDLAKKGGIRAYYGVRNRK